MIKTINSTDFKITEHDQVYDYQKDLTEKLDNLTSDFNQEIINEIVLWKVNRYASLSESTLKLLNRISTRDDSLNIGLTKEVLRSLINETGIRLPMASTILKFKNSKIYQIIDQRVYRILYGKTLKTLSYKSESSINVQIDLYLKYLIDLRKTADKLNIPFHFADRILFEADRRINKNEKLL